MRLDLRLDLRPRARTAERSVARWNSLRRLSALCLIVPALGLVVSIAACGDSASGDPTDAEDVSGEASLTEECAADADCGGGEVCREGLCRLFCRSADDCPEDSPFCEEDLRACGECLVRADCGDEEECDRGRCLPDPQSTVSTDPGGCTPGARRCDGPGTLLVCGADGDREITIRCEEGTACDGPSPPECRTVVCTPGETGCASSTESWRCNATGTASEEIPCPEQTICEEGACLPTDCVPDARRCDDPLHFICSDDGRWVEADDCEASTFCLDHPAGCACEAENGCVLRTCVPDATRCDGNDLQTCDENGEAWLDPTPCPVEESCLSGACVPLTCAAGDRTCAGDMLLTCASDGAGWAETDCAATGRLCRNEACVDLACTPGERRCTGGQLQRCTSTGDGWQEPETCPGADVCRNGACVTPVCDDGERRCDGEFLETCAADNTAWERQNCGDTGRVCRSGACITPDCTPGETRCDGTVLLTCTAAGDDETQRDCADDLRQCAPPAGGQPARCGACLDGHREEGDACVPLIGAPTGLTATTDITAHVRLTWNAVPNASGYHVYRNNVRLTQSPVSEPAYNDEFPPAPPEPDAPGSPAASSDRTDGVRITWSAVSPVPGPVHTYYVRALDQDQVQGVRSETASGRRAGAPIDRYDVEVGGAWTSAGTATELLDTQAPMASLAVGAPSAVAVDNRIDLTVEPAQADPASERSYRIRAISAAGTGSATAAVTGRRSTGPLTYTWSWSPTGAAPWTELASGSSPTATDSTIPPNTTRHYRVVVSADGATPATSPAVEGRLPVPLGSPCDTDVECGASAWCPSGGDAVHRRCAPRPAPGEQAMPFHYIPAGQFVMGSPPNEAGRIDADGREDERPVTITRPFFLADAPVTQLQWRGIAINNISLWPSCGDTCPVDRASWWSAVWYANRLSEEEGLEPCYVIPDTGCTGNGQLGSLNCGEAMPATTTANLLDCEGYRLPTEAEWEYAVRAGTTTATWLGDLTGNPAACETDPALDPIAWYCANSGPAGSRIPLPVRGKDPNPWGLYDMLGNMMEWTTGFYQHNPGAGPFVDPTFTSTGTARTVRSGSYGDAPRINRAAYRFNPFWMSGDTNIGFRLARSVRP